MRKPLLVTALTLCLASAASAQSPMFIVNGVRLDRCEGPAGHDLARLANIDPAAIENIEVIKGAAAAQQYGPDAANGVITVTTRKGSVVSLTTCGPRVVRRALGDTLVLARDGANAVGTNLYSPEFVIAHQEAIALTDQQRASIQSAVATIQSKAVVDAQFKLGAATERLNVLLSMPSVDEAAVLQRIDEMLTLEREVKRAQVTLLVRVKNQLTPAQQKQLDKLRSY
jgi:TonB-dependent SusC/RagA subfamily outer membrane receptor